MPTSNKYLFEITNNLLESNKIRNFSNSDLKKLIFNELNNQFENAGDKNLESIIKEYLKQFHYKWQSVNSKKTEFIVKYAEWLSKEIIVKNITPSKIGRPLTSDLAPFQ